MVAKFSKFGKKKNRLFESMIASAVFGVMLLGIMGFFIYQNANMGQKRALLENRLQELQAQASELSRQKEKLEANIANTQTEEYEEKLLREQGLYKKKGEQVVTILPPENPAEALPPPEEKERVWWQPWTW